MFEQSPAKRASDSQTSELRIDRKRAKQAKLAIRFKGDHADEARTDASAETVSQQIPQTVAREITELEKRLDLRKVTLSCERK